MSRNDWSSGDSHVDELEGTDGWVEPEVRESPEAPMVRQQPAEQPSLRTDEKSDVEKGKALAILSHASILFGMPVFIIPMVTRDSEFSLHHGKAAAVNFGFFLMLFTLTFISCGLLFPLMLLCYVPALVGIIQAANGQHAGPWAFGGLGQSIFKSIDIKDDDTEQLPDRTLPDSRTTYDPPGES